MNKITLTSKIYADALVKLGQDYSTVLKDLKLIQEVINISADLQQVLNNPTINDDMKFSIIDDVFTNKVDKKIIDFVKVIIEKKRFSQLDSIVLAYEKELDKINNVEHVEIISAIELNDNLKQQIIEKLQNKLQKNVIPNWNTDEDIIGGLVVKINDDIIDTSLKNKLENLSKNIKGNLWH